MKTVTIPSDYNPFVVKVNNQEYFYKAGETVEVPDEVAEVILHYTEAKAQEPEKLEYIEGFSYDPVSDAGKVLQVRDDGRGVEWGANSGGGGGGSSPFEEQYGVAGWHSVEITFQSPEGSGDNLENASIAVTILIVNANRDILKIINLVELNTMLISENKYILRVPYLTGDDSTSYFNVTGVNGENYYVTDGSSATYTGDVEYDSYIQAIKVTGDGAVMASLDYSD